MLSSIPAIVKILCVFCLILLLNRLGFRLSLSLLIGSLVLGLWMGLGPLGLSHLKIYRHLFMPALTVMVSAVLLFLISRAV